MDPGHWAFDRQPATQLPDVQIKPAPSLGNNADTSHIIGFGTLDDRMRILMDVERLMASADLGSIKSLQ